MIVTKFKKNCLNNEKNLCNATALIKKKQFSKLIMKHSVADVNCV